MLDFSEAFSSHSTHAETSVSLPFHRARQPPRELWITSRTSTERSYAGFMFTSGSEDYRTCAQCGADCSPEPFDAGGGRGIRIAFSCQQCGLHSIIDPFENRSPST